MRIKSLAQGENILMLGIEPSTFVSKIDILTTTPIVHSMGLYGTVSRGVWSSFKEEVYGTVSRGGAWDSMKEEVYGTVSRGVWDSINDEGYM